MMHWCGPFRQLFQKFVTMPENMLLNVLLLKNIFNFYFQNDYL